MGGLCEQAAWAEVLWATPKTDKGKEPVERQVGVWQRTEGGPRAA